MIHAPALEENFYAARMPAHGVLQVHAGGRNANPRPSCFAIHQTVLRICGVDAVPIFTIVRFHANASLLIQQLLELNRVVRRAFRLEIRILKLSQHLDECWKLRILPECGGYFRIRQRRKRDAGSRHPDILAR